MFDGGDYKLLAWEARDVIELTKYRDRSAAELWDHRLWVGSKLVTDDVSLASHGNSIAISADTEDDSLLLTESRRSTCVVFSARSMIATEDGFCLAPHGDSSYFM
ncbi:hypothetical protein HID58_050045 [Brassica napus]|uniref:Coatomer WD associated region domain-containing protein n=1 Tax=Brassica napus TaxID=3708 RepID=A0ABQ8A686_BRANA|nr:hypothetical protein HID58_050045 [Brassica napus]